MKEIRFDTAYWQGKDGKLFRNDRLAAQIDRQPLHFEPGVKTRSVGLQAASVAFCFAALGVSCGLWWLLIAGIKLLMR